MPSLKNGQSPELGDDPFRAVAASLKPLLQEQGYDVRKIHDKLSNTGNIGHLVKTMLLKQPPSVELLLFVDQFEELFTQVAERHRKPFSILLGKMAETERLRTILTLRADFYHHCLELPQLARFLQAEAGSFPLAAPDQWTLMEMIMRPAEVAGLSFEDELPGRILRDTGSEPGSLALMAFALAELYNACQPGKTLTHAAYNSFGGVTGVIGKRAEDVYSEFEKEFKEDAKQTLGEVFTELVEVDPERGVPTRKRSSLARFDHSPAALMLIGQFAKARLLICDDPTKKEAVVEVAHEALLTHWPRLKGWIEERFDDFRVRRQLQHAAVDWKVHSCADAYLWSDERVIEASGMLERIRYQPTEIEQRFLGPIDPARMLEELTDPGTSHERRALIGVCLALIGDPRPGVGLRADGVPDIIWCKVPGGEVVLEIEEDRSTSPTLKVEPCYISKYLVTWAQYRAFLEDPDGYRNREWWAGLLVQHKEPGRQFQPYDNNPAENVSWLDTVAFCHWLSERLGYEIRLPMEWEWQQAATGGDPSNAFPWGAEWDSGRANTSESRLSSITAVGMYPHGASPIGTLDMSGNVWEWCLNEYEYPERTDLGGEATRVVRGGSWYDILVVARAAFRGWFHPGVRDSDRGFRVVCSSPILP